MNVLHGNVDAAGNVVHTLHPGDVVCAERGERLETLLGSCVAVILTDQRRTVGAMCHIVHCKPAIGVADNPAAFADVAISTLYASLRARGFNPGMCEAFVYGGGNMFPELFKQSHVGDANARWVLDRLASDGVKVLVHDLGGSTYRRLAWNIGPEMPQALAFAV